MGRRKKALRLIREAMKLLSSRRCGWKEVDRGLLEHTRHAAWITIGSTVHVWLGEGTGAEKATVRRIKSPRRIEVEWEDGSIDRVSTQSVESAEFPLNPIGQVISKHEVRLVQRLLGRPDVPWAERRGEHAWTRAIDDRLRQLPARTPSRIREAILLGRATIEPCESRHAECGICKLKRPVTFTVCGLDAGSECATIVRRLNTLVSTIRSTRKPANWRQAL